MFIDLQVIDMQMKIVCELSKQVIANPQSVADSRLNSNTFGIAQGPGELGAYNYEAGLWNRGGISPAPEYLKFQNSQLSTFDELWVIFEEMRRVSLVPNGAESTGEG